MLKDNDGLLAKFISEKRKISYKKSLKLILDEVKVLNEKLSEDLIFDTDYLGIFELKEKNILIFNPDFSINFDSSVFGLNSFVRKPIINKSSNEELSMYLDVFTDYLIKTIYKLANSSTSNSITLKDFLFKFNDFHSSFHIV